jgi:hypothetical protein
MLKELVACIPGGVLVLALCLLVPAGLTAAPICAVAAAVPCEDPASCPDPADMDASPWEFVFTALPDGDPARIGSPAMELASLAAANPGPPASTLLVIGAAMIWLAGVIRYSPLPGD